MRTTTHDPADGIYATGPDYAHAIELVRPDRLLLLSGTMGLDADGAAPPGLAAQLDLV